MKSYLGLIPISAKKRKKRNIMTLLCIIIAVFMVTGIFSMADVAVQNERIHAVNKQGDWHFTLQNVSEEKLLEISKDTSVDAFSRFNVAGEDLESGYYINGKVLVLCCCDEDYTDMIAQFEKDSYPKEPDGIIINESMGRNLNIQKGDTVTVSTPFGEKEMTVSGFNSDNYLDLYDACQGYVTPKTFSELTEGFDDIVEGYYRLKSNRGALKTVNRIKEEYGIFDNQIKTNTMLLAAYGNSDDNYIVGVYYVAALLIVLVIAAGVLMIAGSISASVAERTSFYGMLRCIGAGKKQVLKLVRFEALNWCVTAVPVGVICGTLGSWGLTAALKNISSEFADMPLFYISVIGVIAGSVSGVVTVWLASAIPARKASRVSPVAAVSGNTHDGKKHRRIKKLTNRPELVLGSSYALESKKSVLMISGSFALCIVVCLVFVCILQLIGRMLNPLKVYAPDVEVYASEYSSTINPNLTDELNEMPEIKNAFGRMYSKTSVKSDKGVEIIDLISYDDLQFEWSKKDKLKGDIDKAAKEDGYVITVFDKSNPLSLGDVLYIEDNPYEVAAVLDDSPFSSSDIPTVICSETTFESIYEESNYSVIDIQLNDEYMDVDQKVMRDVFGEGYILSDRRESNKETTATYYAFNITVYAFIALLALISVINIINSISMSTQAKMKQFGMMRAIGLDNEELRGMISSQGIVYALIGIILGLVIGVPLHFATFTVLVTRHFGDSWELPVPAILAILAVIAGATALAVILPVRRIENTPVTEVISEL